ncbi:mitochondrial import receptor subunit TOM7 homolog [Camelus dromedarius]|uniref:Mitochondrial import receptor subunit TOM7 homolog n=2 Tax=Camelus TaxID=9836 RepID=A0A8B7K9B4_CAMFR|nr:mitochondrial import receptor subunit TOM7 homolog [Camelus ferus]XP_045366052.1 mitochondrial import receptor subunit TOM7 homolog [Camelus bactrianus]
MVKQGKAAKQGLPQLFKSHQFATHWGFTPLMMYLGFKRGAAGMAEPTIVSLL